MSSSLRNTGIALVLGAAAVGVGVKAVNATLAPHASQTVADFYRNANDVLESSAGQKLLVCTSPGGDPLLYSKAGVDRYYDDLENNVRRDHLVCVTKSVGNLDR